MAFKDKAIAGLKSVISAEEAANLQEAADNFRRERDELRLELSDMKKQAIKSFDDGVASAKRSMHREIYASKGGGWRTRPIRWAVYGAAALAVLGVAVWLASRAQASEPCAVDIPDDLKAACRGGKVFIFSPDARQYAYFDLNCGPSA